MDCYILWVEIKQELKTRAGEDEIKKFINFIESVVPGELDLLYSNALFNLNRDFQCALASLKAGLELIFIMEEALIMKDKPFELQYVITYGNIEIPRRRSMFRGIIGYGLGRADIKMQRLRDSRTDRFYVDIRDREESEFLTKLLSLYQRVYDSWSRKDCKLIAQLIIFWDYNHIAKDMNKDRALIWRRRKSLGIQQYNDIKDLILSTPDLIFKKKPSNTNEQPPVF